MTRRSTFDHVALAVASIVIPNVVFAHHGFGNFDRNGAVALDGVVTGVDFVNPH